MNLRIYKVSVAIFMGLSSGCAVNNFVSDDIDYYVSPLEYRQYDCKKIKLTQQECNSILSGKLSVYNSHFLTPIQEPKERHNSVLKGHLTALEKEYLRKNCQ